MKKIKKTGVSIDTGLFYSDLLAKIIVDQVLQGGHSFLLISAIGDEGDDGALSDAQRQNAQQALSIDATLFSLDPDAALKLISLLDEVGGGTGVQADLVLHGDFLCIH